MSSPVSQKIGFLGAGQMAQALARGFVAAGIVPATNILAADPVPAAKDAFARAIPGATLEAGNLGVLAGAGVVFLAVKPQMFAAVAREIRAVVDRRVLFVSIIAGITLDRMQEELGTDRLIRVMPNTPCLVGKSAAGFSAGSGASGDDVQLVQRLLEAVGLAFKLDEKLLDAVTGLSGSGPAFVYMMIEALSDGGVRVGLPRDIATALAAQTVLGGAQMVLETKEHPAVLKDRVASPGGTTIAGIAALETGGLRAALISAVEAATQRSQELGKR